MQPTPLLGHIQVIEEVANRAKKSRYEREIEDLLVEAEFARQSIIVIEPPQPRGGHPMRPPNQSGTPPTPSMTEPADE